MARLTQETLNDFVATANEGYEYSDEEMFGMFPEFENDPETLATAYDYYKTSIDPKVKSVEQLNSYFPEIFENTEGPEPETPEYGNDASGGGFLTAGTPASAVPAVPEAIDEYRRRKSAYDDAVNKAYETLESKERERVKAQSNTPVYGGMFGGGVTAYTEPSRGEAERRARKENPELYAAYEEARERMENDATSRKYLRNARVAKASEAKGQLAEIAEMKKPLEEKTREFFTSPEEGEGWLSAQFRGFKERNRAVRDLRKLSDAEKVVKDNIELLEAPEKNGEETWIGNFGSGVAAAVGDRDFLSRGVTEIARNARMRPVMEKYVGMLREMDEGKITSQEDVTKYLDENLTQEEQVMLRATLAGEEAAEMREDDLSYGYQAGKVTGESLGFMADFLATGGLASGINKAVVKNAAKWTSSWAKGFGSEAAKKKAVWIASRVPSALARTAVLPNTYANVTREALNYRVNPETGKVEGLTSAGRAFYLGLTESYIENLSEAFGEGMAWGFIKKAPGIKSITARYAKAVSEGAPWANVAGIISEGNDALAKAGYNGVFNEWMEELYGATLTNIRGYMGGLPNDKDAVRDFFSKEQQAVMIPSLAMPAVAKGTVNAARGGASRLRERLNGTGVREESRTAEANGGDDSFYTGRLLSGAGYDMTDETQAAEGAKDLDDFIATQDGVDAAAFAEAARAYHENRDTFEQGTLVLNAREYLAKARQIRENAAREGNPATGKTTRATVEINGESKEGTLSGDGVEIRDGKIAGEAPVFSYEENGETVRVPLTDSQRDIAVPVGETDTAADVEAEKRKLDEETYASGVTTVPETDFSGLKVEDLVDADGELTPFAMDHMSELGIVDYDNGLFTVTDATGKEWVVPAEQAVNTMRRDYNRKVKAAKKEVAASEPAQAVPVVTAQGKAAEVVPEVTDAQAAAPVEKDGQSYDFDAMLQEDPVLAVARLRELYGDETTLNVLKKAKKALENLRKGMSVNGYLAYEDKAKALDEYIDELSRSAKSASDAKRYERKKAAKAKAQEAPAPETGDAPAAKPTETGGSASEQAAVVAADGTESEEAPATGEVAEPGITAPDAAAPQEEAVIPAEQEANAPGSDNAAPVRKAAAQAQPGTKEEEHEDNAGDTGNAEPVVGEQLPANEETEVEERPGGVPADDGVQPADTGNAAEERMPAPDSGTDTAVAGSEGVQADGPAAEEMASVGAEGIAEPAKSDEEILEEQELEIKAKAEELAKKKARIRERRDGIFRTFKDALNQLTKSLTVGGLRSDAAAVNDINRKIAVLKSRIDNKHYTVDTYYDDPQFIELLNGLLDKARNSGTGLSVYRNKNHVDGEGLRNAVKAFMEVTGDTVDGINNFNEAQAGAMANVAEEEQELKKMRNKAQALRQKITRRKEKEEKEARGEVKKKAEPKEWKKGFDRDGNAVEWKPTVDPNRVSLRYPDGKRKPNVHASGVYIENENGERRPLAENRGDYKKEGIIEDALNTRATESADGAPLPSGEKIRELPLIEQIRQLEWLTARMEEGTYERRTIREYTEGLKKTLKGTPVETEKEKKARGKAAKRKNRKADEKAVAVKEEAMSEEAAEEKETVPSAGSVSDDEIERRANLFIEAAAYDLNAMSEADRKTEAYGFAQQAQSPDTPEDEAAVLRRMASILYPGIDPMELHTEPEGTTVSDNERVRYAVETFLRRAGIKFTASRKAFAEHRTDKSLLDSEATGRDRDKQSKAFGLQEKYGNVEVILSAQDERMSQEMKERAQSDRSVKGWQAGDVTYLYLPNITDASDAERAFLMTRSVNSGLPGILGESKYGTLLDRTWDAMSPRQRMAYASRIWNGLSGEGREAIAGGTAKTDFARLTRGDLRRVTRDNAIRRSAAEDCLAEYSGRPYNERDAKGRETVRQWTRDALRGAGVKYALTDGDVEFILYCVKGREQEDAIREAERLSTPDVMRRLGLDEAVTLDETPEAEGEEATVPEGEAPLRTGKGVIYGYTDGKTIYLNPDALNPTTELHEYGHLWNAAVRKNNPALWRRGVEIAKEMTALWEEVKGNPDYASLNTDDEIADEVLARAVSADGRARLEELLRENDVPATLAQRFRKWVRDVVGAVRSAFERWTDSELKDLTADRWMSMTMLDLVNGTRILDIDSPVDEVTSGGLNAYSYERARKDYLGLLAEFNDNRRHDYEVLKDALKRLARQIKAAIPSGSGYEIQRGELAKILSLLNSIEYAGRDYAPQQGVPGSHRMATTTMLRQYEEVYLALERLECGIVERGQSRRMANTRKVIEEAATGRVTKDTAIRKENYTSNEFAKALDDAMKMSAEDIQKAEDETLDENSEERNDTLPDSAVLRSSALHAASFYKEVEECEDGIEERQEENRQLAVMIMETSARLKELRDLKSENPKADVTRDIEMMTLARQQARVARYCNTMEILELRKQAIAARERFLHEAEALLSDGREVYLAERRRKMQARLADRRRAQDDVRDDGKENPFLAAGKPKSRSLKDKAYGFVDDALDSFIYVIKRISRGAARGRGWLYDNLVRAAVEANEKYTARNLRDFNTLDAKVKEIFGWDSLDELAYRANEKIGEVNTKDVVSAKGETLEKSHRLELTNGVAMWLYMTYRQNDGMKLLNERGVDDDVMEEVTKLVDSRYISFADYVQDEFLPDRFDSFDERYREMFGVPMPRVEHYFPLKAEEKDLLETLQAAEAGHGVFNISTIANNIRTRRGMREINLHENAVNVLAQYLQDMNHWVTYSPVQETANNVMTDKVFKREVEKQGSRAWKDFVGSTVYALSNRQFQTPSDVDNAISSLVSGYALGKVAIRISTALKQLASVPAFLAAVDNRDAMLAFGKYAAYSVPAQWKMIGEVIRDYPTIRARWEGAVAGDDTFADIHDTSFTRKKIRQAIRSGVMFPNRVVDMWSVSIGVKAIEEGNTRHYMRNGLNEEEARRRARIDAMIAYNETQQSDERAFQSSIQRKKTGVNAMLRKFQNSSMLYTRYWLYGLGDVRRTFVNRDAQVANETRRIMEDNPSISEEEAAGIARERVNLQFAHGLKSMGAMASAQMLFAYLGQGAWTAVAGALGGDDDDKRKAKEEAKRIESLMEKDEEELTEKELKTLKAYERREREEERIADIRATDPEDRTEAESRELAVYEKRKAKEREEEEALARSLNPLSYWEEGLLVPLYGVPVVSGVIQDYRATEKLRVNIDNLLSTDIETAGNLWKKGEKYRAEDFPEKAAMYVTGAVIEALPWPVEPQTAVQMCAGIRGMIKDGSIDYIDVANILSAPDRIISTLEGAEDGDTRVGGRGKWVDWVWNFLHGKE